MATWQVEVSFNGGSSYTDITTDVLLYSFRKTHTLHNNLSPAANTCEFQVKYNSTLISNLLAVTQDPLVRIHRDASDWFTGIIRNNFSLDTAQRVKPVSIKCTDYTVWLEKRMRWTDAWVDYDVADTSNTSESIVHQLLSEEGSGISWVGGNISETISYFVNVDGVDDITYAQALTGILSEFGYVWDFNESGALTVHQMFPSTVTSTETFNGTNIRGDLRIDKNLVEYDGVEVKYWTQRTDTQRVIFTDTTGGTADFSCAVDVEDGDSYPENSGTTDVYAEYAYGDREVIHCENTRLDYWPTTLTLTTFTNYYKRAKVQLDNSTGSTKTLTKFDIIGDVTYKDELHIVKSQGYSTSERQAVLEARYITAATDAEKYCTGVRRHYVNGKYRYSFKSMTDADVGDIVTVVDSNLSLNQVCRVQKKVLVNANTEEFAYECYGITAFSNETTSTDRNYAQPVDSPQVTRDLRELASGDEPDTLDGGEPGTASFDNTIDGGGASSNSYTGTVGGLKPSERGFSLLGDLYAEEYTIFNPNILLNLDDGRTIKINRNDGIKVEDGDYNPRVVQIGQGQGLKVSDSAGETIHDIPDAPIQASTRYLGHLLWIDQDFDEVELLNTTSPAETTWTDLTCVTIENTNVRAGLFQILMRSTNGPLDNLADLKCFLRPNGSSWDADITKATPYALTYYSLSANYAYSADHAAQIVCPIGPDNKIEYYFRNGATDSSQKLIISQVGVFI